MDEMQGLEIISFQIITYVGTARDKYLEAISQAKKGNFERADELLKEGEQQFVKGHKAHTELIQQDVVHGTVVMNLLLTHAQDQLMSAEAFKIIATEFIEVYRRLNK
jgi:PTS system cellobiose-specific IIA component